tara:strand:+ start:192 stop:440 length:249 start_codon:yes stop_codon:yes gene_type:complete
MRACLAGEVTIEPCCQGLFASHTLGPIAAGDVFVISPETVTCGSDEGLPGLGGEVFLSGLALSCQDEDYGVLMEDCLSVAHF